MEVSQVAAYTLSGSGLLDLHGLIYNCPRLLDLELYHLLDASPYRSLDESIKWTYPESLFHALEKNVSGDPTRLRSWRWSSRLGGKKWPLGSLLAIHKSPSFSGLRKIAFINYQKPHIRKNAEDPEHEKLLADSLSVLNLDHLILESSTLANSKLLPLLPMNLKHLELVNCWEVISEDLSAFLISHGSQLRTLTLNHNQSLNLSFLTVLGNACPQLTTLKMNLTYYNVHSSYKDSEPLYEKLLEIEDVPDWPGSLQTIELTQLRKWDIETAKMFFQSLLGRAAILVNLRRLVIKAILNTSWRDRSSFRDEWVGAFETVFKRPFIPPNPHLESLGAYAAFKKQSKRKDDEEDDVLSPRAWKQRRLATMEKDSKTDSPAKATLQSAKETVPPLASGLAHPFTNGQADKPSEQGARRLNARRSTRLAPVYSSPPSQSDGDHSVTNSKDHNEGHSSLRETARKRVMSRELDVLSKTAGESLREKQHDTGNSSAKVYRGNESDSDSDDMPLAKRWQKGKGKQVEFIQGMCDVVSITIDNLRPTETQFKEEDFLDSEPEGDEDWDGTEEASGDREYAW